MIRIRTILILFLWHAPLVSLLASTCPRIGPVDVYQLNEVDVVFIGELLPLEDPQLGGGTWDHDNHFVVEKVYKGDIKPGDTIPVDWKTMAMLADIYPRIRTGKRWLLYLNEKFYEGEYYRKPCGRGRPLVADTDPRVEKYLSNLQGKEADELAFLDAYLAQGNGPVDWKLGDYQAKGNWEEGIPTGEWSYFEEGELIATGSYEKGKKHGKWTFFGCRPIRVGLSSSAYYGKREQHFVHGQANGLRKDYHPNLNPMSEGLVHTDWYEDGSPMEPIRIGPWKEWWPNGNKRSEGRYVPGCHECKSGEWNWFYLDGRLKKTVQYEICLNEDYLMDCEVKVVEYDSVGRGK